MYTQQWYMSYRFVDSYRAGNQLDALISQIYFGMKFYTYRTVLLPIIRSLFTVDSAMVYVIQVCRQLSSREPTRCTNFTNLFWHEILHFSDISSAHHQEFIHCTLSNGIFHKGL